MKEKVLVLVRAIPEKSRKHGYISCVAGINEQGELRRLYPFKFHEANFKKKQWIAVDIVKSDGDSRKESAKVISHSPFSEFIGDFELARMLSRLASSVKELKRGNASLGVVKPQILGIAVDVQSTKFMDEQAYFQQFESGALGLREKVKLPVSVRYVYKCVDPKCDCAENPHRQVLIDWELNELARNLMHRYNNKLVVKAKLEQKLLSWMAERDVFFILGTHFKYKTWMVIGIYYFMKGLRQQKTLGQF